jgi:hypothetical protein
MTDDQPDSFAAAHAERGYTIGAYFPPSVPWEVVDAAFDLLGDHIHAYTDAPWDVSVIGGAGDQLGVSGEPLPPFPYHLARCMGCDELTDDCTCTSTEAEIDAAMAAGEPVEITDAPDLTRAELQDLADELTGSLRRRWRRSSPAPGPCSVTTRTPSGASAQCDRVGDGGRWSR